MSRRLSVLMLVLLAGAGIAVSYFAQQAASPRIAAEQRASQARELLDLLPVGSYDNQPLDQPLPLQHLVLSNSTLLGGYRASRAGQPSAVLLRSQVTGYAGPIELLIAIDANGRLLGSKSLKQGETPGLGGRIAEQPNGWLQGFAGKSRNNPDDNAWALKKDQGQFDQMAGATITSRAVINALHDALRYFDEHRDQLLTGAANE
ncbi:RnfABCDGE type electron transport complex subunit G [Pseudomonas sp. TH05]|uniref:RnfABCDGE type electron transport complex subunit G n=1 Tax=unclassified Pseudomonas TaxID=196821 RepID=UPI001913A8A2|nr:MULTISPECIES: RnfABCDGE type electron transport complex subunit G [unclassified Pseudomonas]MBK5536762.1 RnfABCDGE type electron transport complex subunit G [Pseudomonas sp. TH07]MBK5560123.1 RnfABCDGE type electron transport complex subunit G [Pseudomonas sp. TH05]